MIKADRYPIVTWSFNGINSLAGHLIIVLDLHKTNLKPDACKDVKDEKVEYHYLRKEYALPDNVLLARATYFPLRLIK